MKATVGKLVSPCKITLAGADYIKKKDYSAMNEKGGLREVALDVVDNSGGEETWFRVPVSIFCVQSSSGFAPGEKDP